MESSGMIWQKSSFSATGNCVEVARLDGARVGVRDSKDRSGPVLVFAAAEWHDFINGVKGSEFDRE